MNQQSSFFKIEKLWENFYKFRQKRFTTLLIIILFIISIILYSIDRIIGISTGITIEIILAIEAILIAVIIASTQENQLNKLKFLGIQTKEIAEKLRTETLIQDNVEKFFKNKKYRCFFPVEYKSKPLPSINQGDFYALHILGTYIGEDNLELQGVTTNENNIDDTLLKGNVIFICAPLANSALQKIFKSEHIYNDDNYEDLKSENWPFSDLKLPCWFVEDHRMKTDNCPVRKIMVFYKSIDDLSTDDLSIDKDKSSIDELLISPAQKCYDAASKLSQGKKFKHNVINQRDYGIFARLNKNGNQYIGRVKTSAKIHSLL